MKQQLKSLVRPWVNKAVIALEKQSYRGIDLDSLDVANNAMIKIVEAAQPAAIGKMGSVELDMVRCYLENTPTDSPKWIHRMNRLHVCPGIFPEESEWVIKYCKAFLSALSDLDVLGVWFNAGESKIAHKYCSKALFVNYHGVEPFDVDDPWSRRLEGKNVLVIHPICGFDKITVCEARSCMGRTSNNS